MMPIARYLRSLFLLMPFIAAPGVMFAQSLSYIYLQGDKTTPFYVKMEGKMMPRYGRNYVILSELSGGLIHFEVLFQQHAFRPQKFTIRLAENGSRGLMLVKRDTSFVLYDLMTKKYLETDNEQ